MNKDITACTLALSLSQVIKLVCVWQLIHGMHIFLPVVYCQPNKRLSSIVLIFVAIILALPMVT